jgi:Tfp pilus assembly protein PilF
VEIVTSYEIIETNRQKQRFESLAPAVIIGLCFISLSARVYSQSTSDASLSAVRASDQMDRAAKGATQVTAAEHMRRAAVYMANRAFAPAREHWQAVLDNYPNDASVPAALYGFARSLYQERRYEEARLMYERVARDYPETKEGREGSNFAASSLLRMGKGAEAAARYEQYINKYPNGERMDTAHLNIIDGYREARRSKDAILWIDRTRQKFAGTTTETSAILRDSGWILRWAIGTMRCRARTSSCKNRFPKIPTRARRGALFEGPCAGARRADAGCDSFLFHDPRQHRFVLRRAGDGAPGGNQRFRAQQRAKERAASVRSMTERASAGYPAAFGSQVVREAKKRGLDPRLVLAIMKQESQFKPNAKSPAAARGLLQLTFDAAQKYAGRAGLKITDEGLYQPATNIAVGSEYIAELSRMFAGLPEAIALLTMGAKITSRAGWAVRIKATRAFSPPKLDSPNRRAMSSSHVLLSRLSTALRFEPDAAVRFVRHPLRYARVSRAAPPSLWSGQVRCVAY